MAQSAVDCSNSALQRLGATPIMAFTDDSREARQCVVAYDSNRRAELRKHRWNFATKRAVLAPDAEAPAFDYTYQFTIPADCLRVLLPADATCDWVLEGRKILSNQSTVLYLRYVSDITDVTQWDAAFYDLVAVSMAMDMCETLTNSASKMGRLQDEYRHSLAEARKSNAFEQLPQSGPDDSLWLVRL
jgi:hypothetical protein